ncbi:small ribosomal subunit protein mL103 (rPPR7)-like [Phragmites australis]|uniref:small ribosomal subunit protein mL103 (rPPR7)-like n=1 Tax=Phragmites australis TaxID=29695 RepID=UPI002D768AC9|nr:small ribosomal subunit protein mL103 (rPPR7)-like [Phragmites australis]
MAALATLLRRGRRAHALLPRALSTTTTGADPALTGSGAKKRLRREHDPDRVVSLIEAIDTASLSAASTRHALSLAARRLSRSRRFADAEALLSSHLPASPTEPHLAAVLCSYASASLPEKALSAFRSAAPSLPTPISPLPFNALLSAFLRCRRHHRIPVLFAELSKEFSITPNATSYGILVKAYCMTRDDAKAQQVLDQMREQGISPTTSIYTSLIDSMYKQKKTEEAERLWKEMMESGCKPDVATYNVKAMYRGLHGKPDEVLLVMAEMEAAGVKPDTITYNFLMTSYCRDGKVEDAKRLYHSLAEKGCSANAATYKHMLAELCAHGDFDAGLGIFKESLKRHKVPDFKTMKGLVEGLAKEGRVTEAKEVIVEVKKQFPENLLSGWKKLEKELGLDSDSQGTPQPEGTSEETLVEKFATAETLELEESSAEETAVSVESSEDEMPAPEASMSEEVPRGPA